jgi:hypothetical protein
MSSAQLDTNPRLAFGDDRVAEADLKGQVGVQYGISQSA